MEATPFEQDVDAEATKCTGDWTVAPLPGALTETLARAAGTAIAKMHTTGKRRFCMKHFSNFDLNLPGLANNGLPRKLLARLAGTHGRSPQVANRGVV
jgi:hypothetical protein